MAAGTMEREQHSEGRVARAIEEQTASVEGIATLLRTLLTTPLVLQDERLSSHEAEQRLAQRERDWRKRKEQIDAMAAAVILQDYLDTRPRRSGEEGPAEDADR